MNNQFVVDGKFVGITNDGKVSLPKGCARSSGTKAWLGKLLTLIWLHNHCTSKGEKSGREGLAGSKTAFATGDMLAKSNTVIEAEDDALLPHFAQLWTLIDVLLERATDPVVFAVQRRIYRSEEILYSQLHRHLHQAVFASDDVIMLESMPRAGLRGRFEASDMIGLLCWLALDVVEGLELRLRLPENVRGLAENFSYRHLRHGSTLFGEERQGTLEDLRTTFEEVRRYHPPVDADTEDLVEVIENYLYAGKALENRGAWQHEYVLLGSDFFDVWEMLCLYHAYENFIKNGWNVLIADGGNLPNWLRVEDAFKNTLVFEGGNKHEYFSYNRPDLILYQEDENKVTYRVIDFKYYKWDDLRPQPNGDKLNDLEKKFFLGSEKYLSKSDIAKSWGYAQSTLCWHNDNMLSKKVGIKLEFWLPSDTNSQEQTYSAGELHPKPITTMIENLLKASPNPWLQH